MSQERFFGGIAAWRGMLLSLNIGGWSSLAHVMYGIYDHPALIDEMMEHVTHFMLTLIGGLDVRALEKDKAAIEKEIRSLALPLLEQGGCVPMVDERIRSYVSFENRAYYQELIRRLAEGACPERPWRL